VESSSLVHLEVWAEDSSWLLRRDGRDITTASSEFALRRAVVAEVNAGAIQALSRSIGFHAGAVEFPAGIVIFPGHSNAGKSTLVAQLLQRGHRYLTDEASAINVISGDVLPFTKSLCIDSGARSLFSDLAPPNQATSPSWDVDPARIGPGKLGEAGPPVAFVFPTYQVGGELAFSALTRVAAMERLLENSFDFAATGEAGAERMLALADNVPCFELLHGGQPGHLDVLDTTFGTAEQQPVTSSSQ